jgi:hypothetical protein
VACKIPCGWRIVISPIIPYDSPPCYHSSMRHLVVLFIHLHVVMGIGGALSKTADCPIVDRPMLHVGAILSTGCNRFGGI